MKIVLDTNVLVSALRSRRGRAFRLLARVGTGAFSIALSVPLVLEYEDALTRAIWGTAITAEDVAAVLDHLCRVGERHEIFFLWRPTLPDAKDDMVLEVAVAGGCDAIVTFNRRDFRGAEKLGIRILTPAALLAEIGE